MYKNNGGRFLSEDDDEGEGDGELIAPDDPIAPEGELDVVGGVSCRCNAMDEADGVVTFTVMVIDWKFDNSLSVVDRSGDCGFDGGDGAC